MLVNWDSRPQSVPKEVVNWASQLDWWFETTKWLWIKTTGYPKNPIGKRKNRPKPVVPKGGIFLTHSQVGVKAPTLVFSSLSRPTPWQQLFFDTEGQRVASDLSPEHCRRAWEKKQKTCKVLTKFPRNPRMTWKSLLQYLPTHPRIPQRNLHVTRSFSPTRSV